ncbi:MAG: tRNA (adenosine(37)-N6)-threonylcarbamoyltransferase complex ATPase subunit type 1 TsaE [Phycisphaerales bacterium]|jgi:tRNA threonylcarbamoyl adenosine modification protein YjeE|nr:tRNA (adenosine(37)-N6)-threonylcarbamoyltransferase complex ATPase subunit type 1 TsaE [Phycisphaerales bacterium]
MNELEVELPNLASHQLCGAAIGGLLVGGDVVALRGELGAGKTTLVTALGHALGVTDMSSPTFGIIHEHPRPQGGRLLHVDAYRLRGSDELLDLGWDEWAGAADTIVCVEWADRIGALLDSRPHLDVRLWHTSSGRTALIHWDDSDRLSSLAAAGDTP